MRRLLFMCGDFYSVRMHLTSAAAFTQWGRFSLVERIWITEEAFIWCIDVFPVRRLLSYVGTFIQRGHFYLMWRLFSLTKQQKSWNCYRAILKKNYSSSDSSESEQLWKSSVICLISFPFPRYSRISLSWRFVAWSQ